MEIKFPLNVALFDSDPDRLENMRFDLEDIDCINVVCFRDPKECFERVTMGEFNIVISDMNMPEKHGDKMLDEMIRLENGVKVIVVANKDEGVDPSYYLKLGASHVALRPFQKTGFISEVADVVNFFRSWKSLLDELANDWQKRRAS